MLFLSLTLPHRGNCPLCLLSGLFCSFLSLPSPAEFLERMDLETQTGVNPGSITNSLDSVSKTTFISVFITNFKITLFNRAILLQG